MKEKNEKILIERINGVDIYAVKDDNGKEIVPLKPICSALGVSYSSQVQKVQSHPIYSSVVLLSNTTGADGKQYDMLCIDAEFVYGWLLGINPDNVSDQVRDNLIIYQIECHHALYRHFHGRANRLQEFVDMERQLMDRRETLQTSLSELLKSVDSVKSEIKDIDKKFNDLKSERLNPTPSLFD